jgi:hypothetical protein
MDSYNTQPSPGTRDEALQPRRISQARKRTSLKGFESFIHFRCTTFQASSPSLEVGRLLNRDPVAFQYYGRL